MTKFEKGHTYSVRSLCDYDCIFSFEVIGRNGSLITLKYHDRVICRRAKVIDGAEQLNPFGVYSMSPILRADRDARTPLANLRNVAW